MGRAGQDAALVADDRLGHRNRGGGRGVVGAAGLEQADDLGAAVAGTVDDVVQLAGGDELRDRHAADGGVARQRDHVVAVAAHDQGLDVFDAAPDFLGDEGAVTGHVEYAGLADDAVGRQVGGFPGGVDHRVERVRHDDQHAVGALLDGFGGDLADDLDVGLEQLVAAHAGLAGDAGGDDDHVAAGGFLVAVGAGDSDVVVLDGRGLGQIERLALRHAFHDIDQDDVAQFLGGGPMGAGGPDVSSSDDRDFRASHGSMFPTGFVSFRFSRRLSPFVAHRRLSRKF